MPKGPEQREITPELRAWGGEADSLFPVACRALLGLPNLPQDVRHAIFVRLGEGVEYHFKGARGSGEFEEGNKKYRVRYQRKTIRISENTVGSDETLDVRRTTAGPPEKQEGFSLVVQATNKGRIGSVTFSTSTVGLGMSIIGDSPETVGNIQRLLMNL